MTDTTLRDEITDALLAAITSPLDVGARPRDVAPMLTDAVLAVQRIAAALRQAAAIEATVETPRSPDAPVWYGSSSAHGWFCGWDAGYLAAIASLRAVGAGAGTPEVTP